MIEDLLLCGLAGAIAARQCGAAFVLDLRQESVIRTLFDDRVLAVLDTCLRGCAAVLVTDQESAAVLSTLTGVSSRVIVVSDSESGAIAQLLQREFPNGRLPWTRLQSARQPVSKPVANGHEITYVRDVLESGWWGYGPVAQALERWFCEHVKAGGALALTNCTAALHLALQALNLQPGDEIIVPAITFVSTVMAVTLVGATPRFADVDPQSMNITSGTIAPRLSPRTRAVIAVHYAGVPVDLAAIEHLLRPRGITLIEDAAHALGASRDGRLAGMGSDFACFSFAPTKVSAAGSGGVLTFRDPSLAPRLRRISNVGLAEDTFERDQRSDARGNRVECAGYRYRMDDLNAAVAYAQVEQLPAKRQSRAKIVSWYRERLRQIPACRLLDVPQGTDPTWYIFPVFVPAGFRNHVRQHLAACAIDSSIHYPSMAEQPFYQASAEDTPVSNRAARSILSLPLHEDLTIEEVGKICDALADALGSAIWE
ncbi:MAG: DegT/DnrJ/EryC1/StrS family aminotransferase [Acidobacteriota bacterium]|nr:DegT/DnrJ/EryC1/StrS family aminotransferase [Acidobacteriota bacterium]